MYVYFLLTGPNIFCESVVGTFGLVLQDGVSLTTTRSSVFQSFQNGFGPQKVTDVILLLLAIIVAIIIVVCFVFVFMITGIIAAVPR